MMWGPTSTICSSPRSAESVVNYLVEKFGIERSRLSAKGYGETRRIAYNTPPKGEPKTGGSTPSSTA
jgi:OOP family OmpA-OmpF porin